MLSLTAASFWSLLYFCKARLCNTSKLVFSEILLRHWLKACSLNSLLSADRFSFDIFHPASLPLPDGQLDFPLRRFILWIVCLSPKHYGIDHVSAPRLQFFNSTAYNIEWLNWIKSAAVKAHLKILPMLFCICRRHFSGSESCTGTSMRFHCAWCCKSCLARVSWIKFVLRMLGSVYALGNQHGT